METCAECGKPILMGEASYYQKDPTCDIGRTLHTACGDPLGLKAKDTEIARLTADNEFLQELFAMARDRRYSSELIGITVRNRCVHGQSEDGK